MFERYTEKARRVIFFARYEASQFGAKSIESEHMLLGLLREDRSMLASFMLSRDAVTTIRSEIESLCPILPKVSTSIDLPLTEECRQALAYAAEESDRLQHASIGTEHIMLGLLRVENSIAAQTLRKRGVDLEIARDAVANKKPEKEIEQPPHHAIFSEIPVFRVTSLERSIDWYRDVLDFAKQHHFGSDKFAIVRRDAAQIMLEEVDEGRAGGSKLHLVVNDIEAFRPEIETRLDTELQVLKSGSWSSEFIVTDPDGNQIIFSC